MFQDEMQVFVVSILNLFSSFYVTGIDGLLRTCILECCLLYYAGYPLQHKKISQNPEAETACIISQFL
jgi:hypothetical protein